MDTHEEKLLLRDEVFQIVGCAIEGLNTLGHGMVEKPYENALVAEFALTKIPFRQSRKLSGLNYPRITDLRVGVGENCLMNSCLFVSIRGYVSV